MKRYLILENSDIFEGEAFGADEQSIGELVFTTGMCGYIETLTDGSYYGQIVLQTFPLIGNYGIIESDFEGKCSLKGYVVNEWCREPSNFRSQYNLDAFLKNCGVPAISGIDTRALTKIIRENGVMNAIISDTIPKNIAEVKKYAVKNAVMNVSESSTEVFSPSGEVKHRIVLMDYGAKRNIIRCLCARGCEVTAVPANTSAAEIEKLNPDGIMLSNGPGDPAENEEIIGQLKILFGKYPIFGICLGHQLLALSQGAKTFKLKYGHRGVNQPVKYCGGRTYITSQNHGYAVDSQSLINGKVSFFNANDFTCEGIEYDGARAFSVQFHPEAASGPHDTEFLFDKFCDMMGGDGSGV